MRDVYQCRDVLRQVFARHGCGHSLAMPGWSMCVCVCVCVSVCVRVCFSLRSRTWRKQKRFKKGPGRQRLDPGCQSLAGDFRKGGAVSVAPGSRMSKARRRFQKGRRCICHRAPTLSTNMLVTCSSSHRRPAQHARPRPGRGRPDFCRALGRTLGLLPHQHHPLPASTTPPAQLTAEGDRRARR